MGHAEILAAKQQGPEQTAAIQRASWHLLTLVENLLEQARTGEGTLHLNVAPVDIEQVFGDMKELFGVQARSRDLEFSMSTPQERPILHSDELRLRQVLISRAPRRVSRFGLSPPAADRVRPGTPLSPPDVFAPMAAQAGGASRARSRR